MSKNISLTEGNVLSSLLKFTIPVLFSILLQTAYGTADLLIVSRFSSISEVSAVTIGSQIMQMLTSLFTGLAMGTTILIAKYSGSEQHEKTTKIVGNSIIIFAFLSALVTSILMLFNENMALIMKTPVESIEQTKSYLFICGTGTVFIVFYNLIGSIFRGIGDGKTPLLTVCIACIINIILDLIFVGVFNLGAKGAGFATITAQGVSVLLSMKIISNKKLAFTFTKKDIVFSKIDCINILKLGIPVALQGVLVSVSFLFITAIVNNLFGVVASASVGIIEKVTGLVMVVPLAFMQSLSAFTAQNIGANKLDRAKQGLFYSIAVSLVFGMCTAYISGFHGTILTSLFTSDPEITELAVLYLKSYAFDCVFVAILFSFSGYFNGYGKTTFVMVQAVCGAFLFRIPLAYILSTLDNTSLFIIGLATPSSTFFQIILFIIFYINIAKKESALKI